MSLFLLVLLAVGLAWLSFEMPQDDAYIVHRYATRLASGSGLTFNDGEYVEGFTSLLWTVLVAFGVYLGFPADQVGSALNIILIIATMGGILGLSRSLSLGHRTIFFCLLCYSLAIPFFKTAHLGLEFPLYAFSLLVLLRLLLMPRSLKSGLYLGLTAGCIFAIRPESAPLLPFSLAALYFLPDHRPPECSKVEWVLISLSSLCLVLGSIVAWRLYYFGSPVPNSVLAKSVTPLWYLSHFRAAFSQTISGVFYVARALLSSPALLLSLVLLILSVIKTRSASATVFLVPAGLQVFVSIYNGGDWMPHHRFINVLYPVLIVGFGLSLEQIIRPRLREILWSVFLLLSLATGYMTLIAGNGTDRLIEAYGNVANALSEHWLDGDILVAEAIGQIGYKAPSIYIHDPMGLTDHTLASDPEATRSIFGRSNWAYTLGLGPEVIITHGKHGQQDWHRHETDYPESFIFLGIEIEERPSPLCVAVHIDRADLYIPQIRSAGGLPASDHCMRE